MPTADRPGSSARQSGSRFKRFSSIKELNAIQNLAKSIRIERAFDNLDLVRALFERHAPYRTMAEYIPRKLKQPAVPLFSRRLGSGR